MPVIATVISERDDISGKVRAGANAITYTSLSSSEIFKDVMDVYRKDKEK